MVKCPHCNRPAMSLWSKAALGPGRVVSCVSCGQRICADWTGIFAAVPAFLGGYTLMRSDSLPVGIAAVVTGLLMMGLLHTFVIPLVRADR